MARKKAYDEQVVLEKAMTLFWKEGYEATSTRMLEKAMGINQFSIYASFSNKEKLYLESLKLYKTKIKEITSLLEASDQGSAAIKAYFYNFIEFSKENEIPKGCFLTNAIHEFGVHKNPSITNEVLSFIEKLKEMFTEKLSKELAYKQQKEVIASKVDYLVISMIGLSISSKLFDKKLLQGYIENVFEAL